MTLLINTIRQITVYQTHEQSCNVYQVVCREAFLVNMYDAPAEFGRYSNYQISTSVLAG